MRILAISTDRNMCRADSAVVARQRAYAKRLGSFDIIVFTTRGANECAEIAHSDLIHIYPTHSRHPLLWGFDALRIALRVPKPDVVISQDPFEAGLVAWIIARMRGAVLNIQVHTDFTASQFRRLSLLNRIRTLMARFTLRQADHIRVVLERVAEVLIKRGITVPVTVLPIFTDTTRYAQLARVKHLRFKIALMYIGRLEHEKRPDRALKALKAARDAGHDAGLMIVGSGREQAALANMTREWGLERYIEWAGWQDDITPFLAAADVVLVPSEYEGYGMVIVEALAAGVPVIATDVGVAREAGAIVVAAKDFPEAVVEWCAHGPRQGILHNQPYANFDEYADRFAADIAQAVHS